MRGWPFPVRGVSVLRGVSLLRYLLEAAFEGLSDKGWLILSRNWGIFFLFLAVVLDVWSRRIVGWAMATDLRTRLVLDALDMAVTTRKPADVVLIDPDHRWVVQPKGMLSRSKNNYFTGTELFGCARMVWVGGVRKYIAPIQN